MFISVVIPAHNAETTLSRCLAALGRSKHADFEIVVVDDGSADGTARIAEKHGARLIRHVEPRGPAAARNAGAVVTAGSVIVFVDADVTVHPTTLERFATRFETDPDLAAVFGSYDEAPVTQPFFSLYRNLLHHFVHQQADEEARTFWAGCGAIRRRVFAEAGGFNERYSAPSIEDIELSHRTHKAGNRILLDGAIQCTHLKRWSLLDMVATDVARRAVPWARLLLSDRQVPAVLNLRWSHRLSTVVLLAGILLGAALVIRPPQVGLVRPLLTVATAVIVAVVALNHSLYRFFARRAGLWFALRSIPIHALYYLYSAAGFAWAALTLRSTPRLEGSLTEQARSMLRRRGSGRTETTPTQRRAATCSPRWQAANSDDC